MMAHSWQTWVAAAALILLLPYAMRFDLMVLARLSLHGAKNWHVLWPVVSWMRALAKPSAARSSIAWVGSSLATLVLLAASVVAVCWERVPLLWLVTLLAAGRTMLATVTCQKLECCALRCAALMEAWLSSAVLALAVVGAAALAAQTETVDAASVVDWVFLRQPLAFMVSLIAVAGAWGDGIGDREGPTTVLMFHCLHASRANAWLVTGSYAWRMCGLAIVGAAFFASGAWMIRLLLVVALLPALLWLRKVYVVGLRERLAWRFWPLLAVVASTSGVLTLGGMTGGV